LIDTSPDLRNQLINNNIKNIDRVIFSHSHADQTHGINDLRIFYLKNNKKIPVYSDAVTSSYLKKTFPYCFKNYPGYPAFLKLNKINENLFFKENKKNIKIKVIKVKHGRIKSLSFIINNKCGYASDVNLIYKKDLKFFYNLEFLVIDCLRYNFHPSHYTLNEILKLIKIINPKKTILTNLHSDLDYNLLLKKLPKNVIPAHDGLSLNL
jgi:phosphoribosyl 1,2-cyclic phosphate phosphodiesterase